MLAGIHPVRTAVHKRPLMRRETRKRGEKFINVLTFMSILPPLRQLLKILFILVDSANKLAKKEKFLKLPSQKH